GRERRREDGKAHKAGHGLPGLPPFGGVDRAPVGGRRPVRHARWGEALLGDPGGHPGHQRPDALRAAKGDGGGRPRRAGGYPGDPGEGRVPAHREGGGARGRGRGHPGVGLRVGGAARGAHQVPQGRHPEL
ncbi:MAG: hypothetical protein AVDCRST_MAG12-2242, partial [uncultured Rubrobacteraceae bacterium]